MARRIGTSSKELKSQTSVFTSEQLIGISPANFDEFLIWACMNINIDIDISKEQQIPYEVTKSTKGKNKANQLYEEDNIRSVSLDGEHETEEENKVYIVTKYEGNDLVHIRIERTKQIPRQIFAIIACIMEFHPHFQAITISSGLDQYIIHEVAKILPISNITEVYLDDNFVKEANYDILLDKLCRLNVLSLARCKIGDACVKNIASKLHYPLPASLTLRALNLSSNRLTDLSCKYLAEALRTNRKLALLNMASNMITDDGGLDILRTLVQFPLTEAEILAYKQRYVDFLKTRHEWVENYHNELHNSALKTNKGKPAKVLINQIQTKRGETFDFERAYELATKATGEFEDPLNDCTNIDGLRHCNGNNSLMDINFMYNSLTYVFLRSLTKVVQYQHTPARQMKGLINVRIDGNPLPNTCLEFALLDAYFDMGVTSITKKTVSTKKDTTSRLPALK